MKLRTFLVSLSLTLFVSSAFSSPESTDNAAYSPESREYHLKAAFLRYVTKFVEWPASSLPPGNINICVFGLVPSYEALSSIDGKDANDRKIVMSKITSPDQAESNQCQILFVTKTEEDKIKQISQVANGKPILTFGDMEHFAEQGGGMNFYILNNRLAIMINPW